MGIWWVCATTATPVAAQTVSASATTPPPPARYATKVIGVEDGLPDPVATAIVQTQDGYLWIGTENGLARYDGVEFVTHRTDNTPGLPHDTIRALCKGRDGTLWIATQGGLCALKGGKFERLFSLDTPITSLAVDRANKLWIGTRTRGVWSYTDGKLQQHRSGFRGVTNLYARTFFEDRTGRMWLGMGFGGPAYFEDGRFHRLEFPEPTYPGTSDFAESADGSLWFGNGTALYRLRNDELTRYGKEHGLGDELVTGVHVDASDRIWVAARQLWRLEHPDAPAFTPVPLNGGDNCREMMTDREGNQWIATAGFGIIHMRPTAFETIATAEMSSAEKANTVAVDGNGVLTLGLTTGGVISIHPDGHGTRIDTGTAPDGEVWSIAHTRDGRLWIGRKGDLMIRSDGEVTEHAEARGVRAIYEDAHGVVWLGAESGGVVRFQNGVFERANPTLGIRDGANATAFAESGGAFFIGLRSDGLIRIKDGKVTRYTHEHDPSLGSIRSLQPERDGQLWIGTRGRGLVLFDDGKVWNPATLSDPFQSLVATLTHDDAGHLFVGCARGILWAPRDEALAAARGERSQTPFLLASESEGIKPGTVGTGSQPASAKGPDGRLWFATRHGVVSVDPRRLLTNTVAPPVHILRTVLNERASDFTGKAFEVPAGTAAVRIDYTAPSFARPESARFRYKLENHDADWVEAGTRRSAFYTNLLPGKHSFQVIAANENGVWNTVGAALTVVQHPHFFQTLWFRVLAISAFTVSIALAVRRWTQRHLKEHLDALERERALNRERTRIARDLHDEIGSSVTKIGYLVDRLEQRSTDQTTQRIQQQLSWQTRLLTTDLDRVVWSVSPANATLEGLAAFIGRFVHTFLRDTSVQCIVRNDCPAPSIAVAPEIQHHVLVVTKEAINNILKHARATKVVVEITLVESVFSVSIQDDGVGFHVNDQLHIERNGLTNMSTRIAEIGGEFSLSSTPGKGTQLLMKIPIASLIKPVN